MKAIRVRYYGATNTRGSRFIASIKDGQGVIASISEQFNYSDHDKQQKELAQKLIDKMGWKCKISGVGVWGEDTFVTINL